ncbi:MAG: hypothetical protein J5819_09315 [Eubacterium sp.]|nr:hypothetical protein [Eubacterium sp.]
MKKHITIRFVFVIGLVEVVALVALFILMNIHITKRLEDRVISDMSVIARDRAELVETYIRGCIDYVDEYSHLPEAADALENPNDSGIIDNLREVTREVAADRNDIEGLYVAQWDTYVLAHINPDSVDKTFRDEEGARELEEKIRKADAGFCTGIVQAPVTKKMVIPVYAPVKSKTGEMIGFVGAAFYADSLSRELHSITQNENVSYSLINAANNTYIFDNDEALSGTPCEDEDILSAIKTIHTKVGNGGYYNYSKSGQVVSCYFMANRDWLFVIRDDSSDVFGVVGSIREAMIIICAAIAVFVIIATAITASRLMRPARAISDQIRRLRDGDYSRGHSMEKYTERIDEFGDIASAVDELQVDLENQYELFFEMLRVQTVGTLVTRTDNSEVVLINEKAMEFMNLTGEPERVTIDDIRNEFDDDALEIVDGNMAKFRDGAIDELS